MTATIDYETYTYDLTPRELQCIPFIAQLLRQHVGKDNAIHNADIGAAVKAEYDFTMRVDRIRKAIHYIRCNNIVTLLCAANIGYWVGDRAETQLTIESLEKRALSQLAGANALRKQLLSKHVDQMQMI